MFIPCRPSAGWGSPRGSLTRRLHGGRQLPVLLRRHVFAIGSFQGDALVTPLDVEIAARVPAGQRGWSAGCDRRDPAGATPPARKGPRLDGETPTRPIFAGRATPRWPSRWEALAPQAARCAAGVSARLSASEGLNCRVKHFDSPSQPGRITWLRGLPKHRGWQAMAPALRGICRLRWEAFWGERQSWKIPFEFPLETQRGPRSPQTRP